MMQLARLLSFVALATVWMTAGAQAKGPSFDCKKAAATSEKIICSDPKLSEIDLLISKAFEKFEPEYDRSKRSIAKSLVDDRNACGKDLPCIALAMSNALETYGADRPHWVDSYVDGLVRKKAVEYGAKRADGGEAEVPEQMGQCVSVRITALTADAGKPMEHADANDSVQMTFSNDMSSSQFESGPSKVGDPVVMCLVYIPRDCPKGDDRGRVYFGLDLRTKVTWELWGSNHSCGGA